jgi:hypothetical protein
VGGTPEEALGRPPDELSTASEAGVAGSAHV